MSFKKNDHVQVQIHGIVYYEKQCQKELLSFIQRTMFSYSFLEMNVVREARTTFF
jgi:hypothetical protein